MARLAALLLLLAASFAAWPDDLGEIRRKLDAHSHVRADFVQTRRMKDLQRPQVARGRMLAWGGAGVIWEIHDPLQAAYVLRENTTIQIADGREVERSAQDDAASARIGRILKSLLQGDANALAQWFDIAAHAAPEHWTITLTPHAGPLASYLKVMHVAGSEYVERVDIEEADGDSTQIRFRNHRDGGALSDEERRLLGAG
jgi:hypothetical protein